MYQGAPTRRLVDGADDVHELLIAKSVLEQYHAGRPWDFGSWP